MVVAAHAKPQGIYGFQGPYRFLSNFYIEPDGSHVEGEFQRAKCAEAQDRKRFHTNWPHDDVLQEPKVCKAIGRQVKLRPDWEDVKVDIMLFYVAKKFKDHPSLRKQLAQTLSLYLEETNIWGDDFWGVYNGKGLNMLGEILMQVRAEL